MTYYAHININDVNCPLMLVDNNLVLHSSEIKWIKTPARTDSYDALACAELPSSVEMTNTMATYYKYVETSYDNEDCIEQVVPARQTSEPVVLKWLVIDKPTIDDPKFWEYEHPYSVIDVLTNNVWDKQQIIAQNKNNYWDEIAEHWVSSHPNIKVMTLQPLYTAVPA